MLASTFSAAGISLPDLNERYFLDEQDLKNLSQHPLVAIGGHTSSHAALATLSGEQAFRELAENRTYLENLVEEQVVHLSFPYGNARACGDREFALAAKAGFATAVTTEDSPLLSSRRNLHALPRVGVLSNDTPATFDARISGLQQAVSALRARN
jgi:peptidoglycan/xylan/chitin deacetylase (PgdA/CDA1 family)